ncbi:RNA polymerase-associated protein LEO1 [[Emmonsia] crescens]|uniref:RNA polymerase-associated protein LEO1 n=1 Tax=[Emmonsia] crescens TaxID=73230 RepID=A0A2B7ZD83_9EURO|nr:RNA polymerase-associated protein LEO1 [Emmonsia crescens]
MPSDDDGQSQLSGENEQKHTSDASEAGENGESGGLNFDDEQINGDDDADLFGSGSEEPEERKSRRLDDEELDSGDDDGRYDRHGSPMEEDGMGYTESLNVMDLSLSRVPEPESTDGEVYTLAMPNFLAIESEDFNPETYVAPPFNSASTSLCWRYDPNDGETLQSNARIVRWSDGSLTLQLASNPKEQYRMPSKRLARSNKARKADYDSELDAHAYLGAAAEASSVFRITSHLTSSLSILPTTVETDDAVQRLKESLEAAARGAKKNADGTVTMFDVAEDPELAKKRAELAEREKLRADRKRQLAADRDLDRGRRVGISYRTGGGGLTVAGLEGDDDMLTTRARGAKKPKRRPNRRGEIYSDEEDEYDRRGRTREDEYDEDDGFLVGSDEEPEIMEDEDEEEEEELEGEDADAEGEVDEEAPQKSSKRETTPKRSAKETPAKSVEPEVGSPHARKKNRYIVDDDEDDE